MDLNTRRISVVVPVYQSEHHLQAFVDRLHASLQPMGVDYELILVDDGSSDGSWNILEACHRRHSDTIHAIRLSRNYGQHNALLCGIRHAACPVIVTLDDDLQHPPEEIPRLVRRLEEGWDVVYATPENPAHPRWRNLSSRWLKSCIEQTCGIRGVKQISAFRAFRTSLRDAFASHAGPNTSIDVLLSWGGARVDAISVRHDQRVAGRSQYTLARLLHHAMNLVVGFAATPFHWLAVVGSLGLLVCVLTLATQLLWNEQASTMSTIAATFAIGICGLQSLGLALAGEFLYRVHAAASGRPSYVVRQQLIPRCAAAARRPETQLGTSKKSA